MDGLDEGSAGRTNAMVERSRGVAWPADLTSWSVIYEQLGMALYVRTLEWSVTYMLNAIDNKLRDINCAIIINI